MSEAMRIICGAPSYRYDHSQMTDAQIWDLALQADKKQYPMTAATDRVTYGLAAGHAYTLLGCYELKDP
jgi:hypothetical protein